MSDTIDRTYLDKPPDHSIKVSPRSIGILAIEADLRRIEEETELDTYEDAIVNACQKSPELIDEIDVFALVAPHKDLIEVYEENIASALLDARNMLKGMSLEDQIRYTKFLEVTVPPFLRTLYYKWVEQELAKFFESDATKLPEVLWSTWLQTRNGASNEQLINFLQWTNYYLEMLRRDPEVITEINNAQAEYYLGVKDALRRNKLHPGVLGRLDEVVDAPVLISDFTDMESRQRVGYVIREDSDMMNISLAASTVQYGGRALHKLFNHEKNHWLGQFDERWLDELLAEHIAQSLLDDQWDSIATDTRPQGVSYPGCFALGQAVLGDMPIQILTIGFTAPKDEKYLYIDGDLERRYGRRDVRAIIERELKPLVEAEVNKGNSVSVATDIAASKLAKRWNNASKRREMLALPIFEEVGIEDLAATTTKQE